MNLIKWILGKKMADCPRCLGKGHVDMEDIKRLKMELFWQAGKCAYCNGKGKVRADMTEKIAADIEYLTTDLPAEERTKLINGNPFALQRAKQHKAIIQKFIEQIEHLYYIENMEIEEVAEYLFLDQGQTKYSESEKNEMITYVRQVIMSKLKK